MIDAAASEVVGDGEAPPEIRVFVVEDDIMFADGLSAAIDGESDMFTVGVAYQIAGTLMTIRSSRPDVALVDRHLPDGDGLELSEAIKATIPGVAVVMFTGDDDPATVVSAMEHDIDGFALKFSPLDSVFNTIRMAHQGDRVYDAGHLVARAS